MSLNIYNEYLKFNRKRLINYSKICLDKYYNKHIFESFLDKYFSIRYNDIDNNLNINNINKELTLLGESLGKDNKLDSIKIILNYFPLIYYFDNLIKMNEDDLLNKINNFRNTKLSLDNIDDSFIKELLLDNKKIDNYLNSFNSKDFNINLNKINNNTYLVDLNYFIKFPKLYSEYSINNVYNKGLVLENRLFIIYYMVTINILKDILDNMINYYIVEFSSSLLDKEDKLKRLFNIIDNNEIKNRIIIKINEEDFYSNKDIYCDYFKDGYKFACILNNNSILYNDKLLKLFSYYYKDNSWKEV